MNSQKKIDVNLSSLLGLKAELERKKREVDLAKSWSGDNRVKPKVKIKNKLDQASKQSKGDSGKDVDVEVEDEDLNLLRKSRAILEAKVKVYDSLTKGKTLGESAAKTTEYLVDFEQKLEESFILRREEERKDAEKEKEELSDQEFEYDFDDEWIDFIDCLGRTKRCHKDDLEAMKGKDEELKAKLFGESDASKKEKIKPEPEKIVNKPRMEMPELCSEDMKKDMLRQKWEEQERIILDKKDIHYQDVLFNEARSHGVGYYEFSTDETERFRQQEELKRTREETLMQQASSKTAAERKKKQAEERAKAAKRRKRERLGLPPEEEESEREQSTRDEKLTDEDPEPSKKVDILQRESDPRKDSVVRPWDVGKEGVSPVMSQKEWIEKKRCERPKEFAPPSELIPRKKRKFENKETDSYSRPSVSSARPEETKSRFSGACVPPPESYGHVSFGKSSSVTLDVEKSIEEGLKFLRKQVEEKQSHTKKGVFDFL